ncbi:hypothetical protein FCOIX_4171 [Fusarium coicis]|nr:hypothetical protein FCOIX_4171 [Fusarium coicis]
MQRIKRFLSKRYSRQRPELFAPEPAPTNPPTSPSTDAGPSCGSVDLSRIEKLPFEIRNEILLAVDSLADLSSVVHTSPTFYQQFRLDRAFWLWHCLKQELGNVLVDAYNVDTYNTPEFRSTRSRQKVLQYVEDYKQQRADGAQSLPQPSEDDVVRIASFHTSVIRYLMQEYAVWAHANLEDLSEPKELSRTEERRILRGLYRFQIFCGLFGPARGGGYFFDEDSLLNPERMLQLLLNLYEPWEIEEILCINAFVHAKYRAFFEQVKWDLNPENPSFDDDNRERMTFEGESYDSPPFAWVVFWRELYSNLYGDYLPPSFRPWGYVMWDKDRLVKTDAVDIIDQEWKAMCSRLSDQVGMQDPRDEWPAS